jgi:hypothetical protein
MFGVDLLHHAWAQLCSQPLRVASESRSATDRPPSHVLRGMCGCLQGLVDILATLLITAGVVFM